MKIEIESHELVKMMTEYWATENNPECWLQTKKFAEKYGFFDELVSYGFTENLNEEELNEWFGEDYEE